MAPSRSLEESDASMRKRLVESLSASFPGSALSRALHAMDDLEIKQEPEDPLSSSCFAELRLDKGPLDEDDFLDFGDDEDDEELTSLAWLQNSDLLKNINQGEDLCPSPIDDVKENTDINKGDYSNPPYPYNPQKHINSKPPYSFSCLIFMAIEDSPIKKLPVKEIYNWILTHFPYFQNAPTGWKNSVRHNLSLNKCFKKVDKEKGQSIGKGSLWCIDPDYRPNLLQALRKTPYHPYHQLQMLAHATPSAGYTILPGTPKPLPLTQRININTPSPHLFPFLSRRLAQSFDTNNTESDIDVANTLVSLKRAAAYNQSRCQNGWDRSRSPSPPEFGSKREKELLKRKFRASRPRLPSVVTEWPSEDHSYSVSTLPVEDVEEEDDDDPDDEYDWGSEDDEISATDISEGEAESDMDDTCDSAGEEVPSKRRKLNRGTTKSRRPLKIKLSNPARKRLMETDDEAEKMKIVEGADALLNLAGIKTSNIAPLRSLSPSNNNNNNNDIKKEPP